MSTASPSVPTTTAATAAATSATASPYGGIPSMHSAQQPPAPPQAQAPTASHSGAPAVHGPASTALACSDPHVSGHASSAALYQQQPDGVSQASHHMASSFPGTQLSPMTSPYAATYGAAQHPMYSASYPGHAYAPYPNYFGHISHYGVHPPHYPAAATSGPAYHAPFMSSMIPHGSYNPHTPAHMPSHHTPAAATMPLSMTSSSASATSPAAPGGMSSGAMMAASSYGTAPQYTAAVPWMGRHRVTTTLWEDEGTLCFQVDVKGVCVARRHDNNMVNGTKLLNVCGMSRGKRDGILKNEKERIVVKVGAMHLKGVWIAFNRGKQLAEQHGIIDILYPLFEPNIQSFLYHPDNYPRTAAVMAAAQERQVHRHYGSMPVNGGNVQVKDASSDISAASLPLHSNLPHSHWGSPGQAAAHDTSATSNATDTSLSYTYPQQHSHYQHPATVLPTAHAACQQTPSSAAASVGSTTPAPATPSMFHSPNASYSAHAAAMPPPTVRSSTAPAAPGMIMDRRLDHAATTAATPDAHTISASSVPTTLSHEQQQQHTAHMSHPSNEARRFSMEKRPSEHGGSLDVSSQHDFHHHVGPSSGIHMPQSTTNSFGANTMSSTSSSFSLDEKRPKLENATAATSAPPTANTPTVEGRSTSSATPSAHQSLDMVYSGDACPTETDVPTQKHET